MPKRNTLYMDNQREKIARAALECMLEKGVAATSTRDVCARAAVSRGALYAHFKSRQDLVYTAVALDQVFKKEPVDDWADYEARLLSQLDPFMTHERSRRLMLVAYEFIAELARSGTVSRRAADYSDQVYAFMRKSLAAMRKRGHITLPLGLERTLKIHLQLEAGAIYSVLADPRLDFPEVRKGFLAAIALTAGRCSPKSASGPSRGLKNGRQSSATQKRRKEKIDDRNR